MASTYMFLMAFTVLLAIGQLLFKRVAADVDWASPLTTLAFSPYFWVALIFYGGATLLWIWILKTTSLSVAYPFVAVGFILVPLGAWFFFGEVLSWRYIFGVGLIVAGVLLTAS